MHKACRKCKEVKPIDEFTKNKLCTDGHEGQCKECKKTYARNRRKEKRKGQPKKKRGRPASKKIEQEPKEKKPRGIANKNLIDEAMRQEKELNRLREENQRLLEQLEQRKEVKEIIERDKPIEVLLTDTEKQEIIESVIGEKIDVKLVITGKEN